MEDYLSGIDLCGTNIKIECFDATLKLIGNISVPTGADTEPNFSNKSLKKSKTLIT